MSKLASSFLLIYALILGVQKCHGVLKLPLQDNIIVGAFAPVDDDGKMNYAAIPKMAKYFKNKNLKVIYVSGYFGGGPTIPLPERKRLVSEWEKQTNKLGLDLIVEVGALPFPDMLEMAHYCSGLNITAITAFAEVAYQASTTDEALEDLQRICDAALNIPLLYHEFVVVNQNIRIEQIFKGAMGGRVSCFVGMQCSVSSFVRIKASVDSIDGDQLWGGGMDSVAASQQIGMNASFSIHLFPDLVWKIKDAIKKCNYKLAADLQQKINRRMYAITNIEGGIADLWLRTYFSQSRAAFELISGIEVGYRYPLQRPDAAVIEEMQSKLEDFGVHLYDSD